MSTQLEEKLNRILSEKKEKIIPENIRAGISIFDVEGSFETLDTSDATATPSDVLDGKIAYSANDTRIEGTYIPLDTSDADATEKDILLGKTAYVNSKKITGTTPNNGELNYVPTTESQEIPSGYTSGGQVQGDANLLPENIKKDVEIFGVTGTLVGGSSEYNAVINSSVSSYFKTTTALTKLGDLDMTGVTSISSAFDGCSYLTRIGNISNTGSVTNMSYAFRDCSRLTELPDLDTSAVINMTYMCYRNSSLTKLPNFNTSKVTNMSYAFQSCAKITELPELDTSKVTDMYSMCHSCLKLTTVPKLNCQAVKKIYVAFAACTELTDVGGFENIGKAYTSKSNNYSDYQLSLSACTKLTHDSLMNIINNLYDLNLTYDVAGGGTLYTQKLNLGSTNLAKLTAEEIAIATAKRMDR